MSKQNLTKYEHTGPNLQAALKEYDDVRNWSINVGHPFTAGWNAAMQHLDKCECKCGDHNVQCTRCKKVRSYVRY